MLNHADLVRDGKLLPEAVNRAASEAGVAQALSAAPADAAQAAALAIAAGIAKASAALPALIALLNRDDLAGTAAGWALAHLDSEGAVLTAIEGGGMDVRQNGYHSLAVRAALGRAGAGLPAALAMRIAAENARAKQKLTGLGEHALRALAILGAPDTDALIQQVLESDPYTDKFELQRLRKAVSDGGRDRDSQSLLGGAWTTAFADQLWSEPAPAAPAPAPAKPAVKAPQATLGKPAPPPKTSTPAPVAPSVLAAGPVEEPGDPEVDLDADAAPATAVPIDWADFATSPEATALPATTQTLVKQLGPLIEQLSVRAINAPLADLTGQELAALLLQVLPQALPPQHLQTALGPHAINGYQALAKYLNRTGVASHGDDLLQGLKLVRQQLQAQIRQSGILGGPDYSDPDEVAAATPERAGGSARDDPPAWPYHRAERAIALATAGIAEDAVRSDVDAFERGVAADDAHVAGQVAGHLEGTRFVVERRRQIGVRRAQPGARIAHQRQLRAHRLVREAGVHRQPAASRGLTGQQPGQGGQPRQVVAKTLAQGFGIPVVHAIGGQHRRPAIALGPSGKKRGLGRDAQLRNPQATDQGVLVVAHDAVGAAVGAAGMDAVEYARRVRPAIDQVAKEDQRAFCLGQDAVKAVAPSVHVADKGHHLGADRLVGDNQGHGTPRWQGASLGKARVCRTDGRLAAAWLRIATRGTIPTAPA